MKYQKQIEKLSGDYAVNRVQLKAERKALKNAVEKRTDAETALKIAQEVAKNVQQKAHARISKVVSRCLETVFDDEAYQFKIIFDSKRNKTEARLVFEREGKQIDPLTASGGGAVDVAAFALRLSCLLLNQPPVRRCVVLDEPFKFVSAKYRDNVRLMLEQLSKDLNVQFIMVTHIEELVTGKVVEIN